MHSHQHVLYSVVLVWFTVGGVKKKASGPADDEPENKRPK